MTIVDAIDSAPTDHAVYFLVTAYIESLRHFERGCGLPQRTIELPVSGRCDLVERLECLHCSIEEASGTTVAQTEAAAVLAAALERLAAFVERADDALAPAIPRARTDSLRSSLSV